MGCGSSQATKALNDPLAEKDGVTKIDNPSEINDNISDVILPAKYPPGEAFEILIVPDDSLIKKHPPKRLKKLLEDRPVTPQTIEDLEEKLENAKLRREQILSQRVEQTMKFRARDKDDEDDDGLKTQNDENIKNEDNILQNIDITDNVLDEVERKNYLNKNLQDIIDK